MKKKASTIVIVLIFLAGIAVFLYPTIATYLYEKNSSRAITSHTEEIAKMSKEEIQAEKEAAYRYNVSLFNNVVVLTDPFDPDAYPITDGNYDELLATDEIMAFIEIPAIELNLPVYHHTSEEVLAKGVGHLENTSLPVGGKSTHAGLSAHCGLPSAELFTDLHLLKDGNLVKIHVLDETLVYQVYSIEVVLPDDTSSLHIQENKDEITLVTCTPYGKNTHRLLVHAERIRFEKAEIIEESAASEAFSWLDLAKIAAFIISIFFVILFIAGGIQNQKNQGNRHHSRKRRRRKRRRKKNRSKNHEKDT